jgi:tetratricopeptide (TPR) repeat protein
MFVTMYLACCRIKSRQVTIMPSILSMIQGQNLPDFLKLGVLESQSIALRACGDHQESSDLVLNAVRDASFTDIRAHCQQGRLILSLVENMILREKYSEASTLLSSWETKQHPPSRIELQVVRMKNTVIGRISRYKGDFSHAAECLNLCLWGVSTETARYHVKFHLADVYCELQRPEAAEQLLEQDVAQLKKGTVASKRVLRRLLLPLAEALILQSRWEEAESELVILIEMFDEMVCPDASDQLGHIRAIIGLARVAHHRSNYQTTLDRTDEALKLVEHYSTFAENTFYGFFLHSLRASMYRKMEDSSAVGNCLKLSEQFDQQPRHFITGLGTYVLKLVRMCEPRGSFSRIQ